MGWWLLRLSAKILAILRLSAGAHQRQEPIKFDSCQMSVVS